MKAIAYFEGFVYDGAIGCTATGEEPSARCRRDLTQTGDFRAVLRYGNWLGVIETVECSDDGERGFSCREQ